MLNSINDILLNLKGSYSLVLVSVILMYILVFIESKITRKQVKSQYYIKVGLLSVLVSSFVIYVNTLETLRIDEEIIGGPVPF